MATNTVRARGGRWLSWAGRSQVERVDLYARQSLYVLLWGAAAVFLLGIAPQSLREDGVPTAAVLTGGVGLTALATVVLRDVMAAYPGAGPVPWRSVGPFVALCALVTVAAHALPPQPQHQVLLLVWALLALALGGVRDVRATVALIAVLAAVAVLAGGQAGWAPFGLVAGGLFVFTVRTSLWLVAVVVELDAARGSQSALAVAEERLRFSRDVHDVLGRRLSTIAVQSELAAALAARGDAMAVAAMLDVRGVAHEALREARELARGYRTTDLGQELDGARSLLRSAGIHVELDVADLPAAWHEAAGWVVREAVTNVLRHSGARTVRIAYDAPRLSVRNDGSPEAPAQGAPGSGLAGVRERLTPLGADLAVEHSGAVFTVVATLAGAGPAGVSS